MKKITLINVATFLVLLFSTIQTYSQDRLVSFDNLNASLTTATACSYVGCNANDVTFGDVYLGDDVGNLATLAYVNNPINGLFIWVKIASNSGKYDLMFQFDYLVGGVRKNFDNTNFGGPSTDRLTIKIRGSIVPAGSKYRMAEITNYTVGQSIELKNIYLRWEVNGQKITPAQDLSLITCNPPKCSSAFSSGIIVKTPLFADFSIDKDCISGAFEQVVYNSTSTGVEPNTNYSWSFPGAATISPSGLNTSGPYTVTYNTSGPHTVSLTISDPLNLVIPNTKLVDDITLASCCTVTIDLINSTNVQCNGNSDGTVTATKTGGAGTITYDLLFSATSGGSFSATGLPTNGDVTGIYTGLGVGYYKVVVTEANGCNSISSEVQITQPATAVSVALTGQTNVLCFGASTGAINITASGGTGSYTYAWTGSGVSATSEDQSGLAAGSYSVIVTDANGCSTASLPVTITQPAAALTANATGESLYCAGDADGNITLTVSGGTASYTYSWKKTGDNVTVVSTAQNPSGLLAGTYNVTVTDANGCTTTASATIIDGDGTDPVVTAPADYSLEGCNTSAIIGRIYSEIDVAIASPYTGLVIVETGTGIASVTYKDSKTGTCPIVVTRTFTVTDNCGNIGTAIQKININDTTPPVLTIPANAGIECTADITPIALGMATATDNCDGSLIPTYTDGDCFGLENEKEVNAGNGIYLYFNISGMASLNVNSIKAFNLTFETNQGKGRAEFILVAPNGKGIVLVGPYCTLGNCDDGDGGVEVYSPTFYPSTSAYAAWVNSNFIAEGAGNFKPNGGSTTNTVTGLTNGLVSSFEALTAGMTSLDGQWFVYSKKQATVNGNVRFISSCLTPGLDASCVNNDVIIREWTVTDACGNGATGNQVIVISDTTAPVVTGSITDTIIEGCSIQDAPAAVTTVAALEALTGNLLISDNCSEDANLTVTSSDDVSGTCPIVITRTYKVTDECSNESVDIIHTIKIDDTTDPTGSNPIAISGLKKLSDVPVPDVSVVTDEKDNCTLIPLVTWVKDENNGKSGCYGDAYIVTRTYKIADDCENFIEVTQTITVEADLVSVDAPEDVEVCDSYILLELNSGNYFTGSGGTGTAKSAGDSITSSQTIYVYAVSADNGVCTDENSFDITINTTPPADAPADVTMCDSYTLPALTNGAYYAATGGSSPIAVGTAITSTQTIYVYAETGTTPNCFTENSFKVTINDTPPADAPADVTMCDSYSLPALTNGAYYAATGGSSPIAVGTAITSTQTIYVYAETGTTPNCFTENSFKVTINDTPPADAPADVTMCDSYTLPELSAGNEYWTATGGTGTQYFATDVISSDITLFVYVDTDTTPNCSDENSFDITIINTPNIEDSTSTNVTCFGLGNGTITVSGLVQGETYIIQLNGVGSNLSGQSTFGPGTYVITASSSGNSQSELVCSTTKEVTITQPAQIIVNAGPDKLLNCNNPTAILNGSASSNDQVNFTYSWTTSNGLIDSGANTPSPTISKPGIYVLTVTNIINGCSASDTVVVTQNKIVPQATIFAVKTELTCETSSITLNAVVSSIQGAASYLWSDNLATTSSIVVTTPGEYTLYVTDSNNGCVSVSRIVITQDITQPEAVITGNTELTCSTTSITLNASGSTVQGTASYLWSTGATTATIAVIAPGVYSVTVKDSDNGCSAIVEVTVLQDIKPVVATITGNTELTCSTTSITLNASGSTVQGTASYLWNTGATTATIAVTTPGVYSVTVTDSDNGCLA
ncbi:MAG: hypothetical protein Q8S45_05070, partial [Lutibacter sp.]|nr:hypothetical protein [Lutibacter sp.]